MAATPYRLIAPRDGLPLLHAVSSPRSALTLGRLLLALLAFLVASLTLTPWQQTASGEGRVTAFTPAERRQSIEAPTDGRIARWHVRDGQHVAYGDPIVDITDVDPAYLNRLTAERDAVEARVNVAQNRVVTIGNRIKALEEARENAITSAQARARASGQRVKSADRALAAAEASRATSQTNLLRQKELLDKGFASARAIELAELEQTRFIMEVERSRAAADGARADALGAQADVLRVTAERDAAIEDARAAEASAMSDAARAAEELARIEVRLSRQQAQQVLAPRAGTILRIVANEGGELVKNGDQLAIIVPDTDARAIEIWVAGNDAPLITPGRKARIQFEGWPAIQFSGWPSVAVGTFSGQVAFVDAEGDGKGKFRVVITPTPGDPWPDGRYLRQGVRAHGWVLLDEVRLGFELWRQFNGFPPTVEQPVDDAKGGKDAKK